MRRASGRSEEPLLGIVATHPGMMIGWSDFSQDVLPGQVPVALSGRVPVKISLENGPIRPGDLLAASPTRPGYAMRASRSGWVVGVALEASRGGLDMILCYVNPHYWTSPREMRELREEIRKLRKANHQ